LRRADGVCFDSHMDPACHRVETAAGAIDVWLPADETLDDVDGIAYWSPDPRMGRFTVTDADGDGDALLATERAHGEVEVEADQRSSRGGADVRRLRYRVRRDTPRDIVATEQGRMHVGGEAAEHVSEMLLIAAAGHVARAGYSVRADAPPALQASFAQVLDRVRIVGER
jgi:hypothetical protein